MDQASRTTWLPTAGSALAEVAHRLNDLCANDDAFRGELVASFIEEGDKDVDRLRRALEEDDRQTLLSVVHLLRGSCATMGARGVMDLCMTAEVALRGGASPEDVARLVADVSRGWGALREDLRAFA